METKISGINKAVGNLRYKAIRFISMLIASVVFFYIEKALLGQYEKIKTYSFLGLSWWLSITIVAFSIVISELIADWVCKNMGYKDIKKRENNLLLLAIVLLSTRFVYGEHVYEI